VTVAANAVGVSNGLFTATLDFGSGVFNGEGSWLEISMHNSTNDPNVGWVCLSSPSKKGGFFVAGS
jgi:hypothetical protein